MPSDHPAELEAWKLRQAERIHAEHVRKYREARAVHVWSAAEKPTIEPVDGDDPERDYDGEP